MAADSAGRFRYVGHELGRRWGGMKKGNPVVDYATIVAGALLIGFTIKNTYDPVSMATSGAPGVTIIAKELWSVPPWLASTVLNIPLSATGFFSCSWRSIKRVLFATVMFSVSLYILSEAFYLGSGPLLSALFGGITDGVGTGLVLLTSCAAGGTDLLAALIQRRLKYYTLTQTVQVLDDLIAVAGASVFGIKTTFYALIVIFYVAKITDGLIEGLKFFGQAYVISERYREIAEAIMEQTGRGMTSTKARGMYLDQKKEMLLCVVSKKETVRSEKAVVEFDSSTFVIVSNAREAFGEGFVEYQALNSVAFADIFWNNTVD